MGLAEFRKILQFHLHHFMKPRFPRGLAAGFLTVISISGTSQAVTRTKADNTTPLDQAASWGGTAPTAADIAAWAGTYNTAGSLSAALPAATLSWQGVSIGTLSGSAAGTVNIGGSAAATAGSAVLTGVSGIDLASASHDLVLNAETLNINGSQTWTVPSGRNLRIGANAATANVDGAGGNATAVTIAGGGTVDANQGASNGFADYTGKWIIGNNTTLRGLGSGTAAWGSNTSADAILLNGGKLAVGAISGAAGTPAWSSPITLGTGFTSSIHGQHSGTGTPDISLQGQISGTGNLSISKVSGTSFIARVDRGDNLYSGSTSIDSGAAGSIAVYAHLGTTSGIKTPFGTGDVSISGSTAITAAVELTTNLASTASNAEFAIHNNINLSNATLRTREGLVSLYGTVNLTGASVIQGQVDLRHINLYGLIAGAGNLTLRSVGTQTIFLPYANTYTGGTILGFGTTNAGIVLLGDAGALGSGTITARGAQIWADVPDLVLTNNVLVGNSSAGGLCFGGSNNISLTGSITVDNASRPFQNSGTGLITLAGINVNAGTSATATFGSGTAKGPFTVTGSITGAGKITVNGGTVTLPGASNYTGATTIAQSGRLHLTGSLTSALVMTGASASISGSGSTSGSLTTSGASGGTILLDTANPTAALTVNGAAFNGPTKVELNNQQPLGSTVYTVLNYTSTLTNFANLSSSNSRGTFTNDTVNKKITFTSSSENRTWNHAASNTWNLTDTNWAEGDNKFFNGDAVTFGNAGAGTVTVAGTVSPHSISFTNTAGNDYSLVSSTNNAITGSATLDKSGTGTAIIEGPNTFTGKTTITGGTLAIRSDSALGAVPADIVADQLTIDGGTLKLLPSPPAGVTLAGNRGITIGPGGATLDTTALTSSFSATVSGDVSGGSLLTVFSNGDTSDTGAGFSGATQLNGFGAATGGVLIKSGVVDMFGNLGDTSNIITLDGGGLVDRNNSVTFSHDIEVAAGGGILRSYGSATTSFIGAIRNASGVSNANLRHTDGGTQIFSGDGSAFQGTYTNARGTAFFDSENWSGTNVVNVDGTQLRFGFGSLMHVKSITTDRDLHIEAGTVLDVVSGNITVAPGTATQNFWIQNSGTLTSSSGTLNFDFQTPFSTAGADDQSVRVIIEDYDGSTPVQVVKNGPGGLNNFDQSNTYTGGTIINAGRISVANPNALGTGPLTVNSGGQAFLSLASATYVTPVTISGNGPSETAGNLGAIRFNSNTFAGELTVHASGARIGASGGATGIVTGEIKGSGNLEINSSAGGHDGTISLNGYSPDYAGTVQVTKGRLNVGDTFGGSVTVADGASLGGEGIIYGALSLGSTTGANLHIATNSPQGLLAENLTLNGISNVFLDSPPANPDPITVIEFTNLVSGGIANLQVAPTSGVRGTFANTGNAITLTLQNEARTWSGAVNGTWDITSLNWVQGDQRFVSGDPVSFTDSGSNKTIAIPSPVSPASVLINNSAGNNYAFTGRMIVPATGSFTKQGAGNLTFSGTPSSVAVPVTIHGGLVTLGTTDYLRAFGPSPEIILNGGTLRINGINLLYDGGGSHIVTVNSGATVELNGYHNHFKTLNLNGGTIRGITSNDPGARYANEYGTFDTLVTVAGAQMSTITNAVGGTGVFSLAGAPFTVGDVTTGTDLLVDASLSGGALTKNGAGTMALHQANTYTGGSTVNAGILLANNSTGSATGTGAVLVKTGAVFGGTGAVTGAVTVESGGTLAPGASIESLGTGALNLGSGSTLSVEINSSGTPAADSVLVTGNATIAGNLDVTDIAVSPVALANGTKLTLMTYTGTLTGTFAGKAEGSSFTVGPNTYTIRYNDAKKVTLEAAGSGGSPYTSWASANGISGAGASVDSDNDGISNGIEFVLGGDPSGPNSDSSALLPTATLDGTYLNFVYRRTDASLSSNPLVQYGSSLSGWTTAQNGVGGVIITSDDNFFGAATDRVTVRIPRSLAIGSKLFARLKVDITT